MVDNHSEFCAALVSRTPALDVANGNDLYAGLIGSWSAEVLDSETDGAKRVSSAEWHFTRILEGRGVQDVLIVPAREDRNPRIPLRFNRYASSLRMFSVTEGLWRVHWCNPVGGEIHNLTAARSGLDIVESGHDGLPLRWTFSSISPGSFIARTEALDPGVEPAAWKIVAEIRASREVGRAASESGSVRTPRQTL